MEPQLADERTERVLVVLVCVRKPVAERSQVVCEAIRAIHPAAEREQVYTVTHQLLTPDQRLTCGRESNNHVVLA